MMAHGNLIGEVPGYPQLEILIRACERRLTRFSP